MSLVFELVFQVSVQQQASPLRFSLHVHPVVFCDAAAQTRLWGSSLAVSLPAALITAVGYWDAAGRFVGFGDGCVFAQLSFELMLARVARRNISLG